MSRHTYARFGNARSVKNGILKDSIPARVSDWPRFDNIADLADWWFSTDGDDGAIPRHPRDLRTAVIKTRAYVRATGCGNDEQHWEHWWSSLNALNLPFQDDAAFDPARRVRPEQWRGWVQLPETMSNKVKASIASAALAAFYPAVGLVHKVRHAWKWALPYAHHGSDQPLPRLGLNDRSLWTALVAIHKARAGDFHTLEMLWGNHEPRLGLPIATMAMVYLPKTPALRDLLQSWNYFREEPVSHGGVVLGMEVLYRMAREGWLQAEPPAVWGTWCNKYLNNERDRASLSRAFENTAIPWAWKRRALEMNILSASTSRLARFHDNVFAGVSPPLDAPENDRRQLVKTLLAAFATRWDTPADDESSLREPLTQWALQWLPEASALISLWPALDLSSAAVAQTLEATTASSGALPAPDDTPLI